MTCSRERVSSEIRTLMNNISKKTLKAGDTKDALLDQGRTDLWGELMSKKSLPRYVIQGSLSVIRQENGLDERFTAKDFERWTSWGPSA